ncbi:hypothetical protein C5167_044601 [Papaver somniferum]|uniref:DDE Tnp4 domain-containing protein n=1 Tax=Papaver somniferum TaxID=3469 RepID=A0A4Y7L9W5_PAPSO|nr:hypothetical protein C5167_044601 [Papaver somniferum]
MKECIMKAIPEVAKAKQENVKLTVVEEQAQGRQQVAYPAGLASKPIFAYAKEHDELKVKEEPESNRKRKRMMIPPKLIVSSGTNNLSGATGGHRRLWVKDRSKAWWDSCNHPDFPEAEFRKAFRMSRSTFDMICEELSSVVAKEDTMLRAAIPVQQRVAVCIWRLATGEPLRLVSKKFGLGISTCHKLVLEVCSAIKTVLMPKYLQWPSVEALENIKADFEKISGIPNVVGSMYTTHIPIIAPKISVSAYFNRRHTERNQKTSYSITVQGVVDHKGVFTDCCIGWPGSMSDDQILAKSALYQRANGGLLKDVWIAGTTSYPLTDWAVVVVVGGGGGGNRWLVVVIIGGGCGGNRRWWCESIPMYGPSHRVSFRFSIEEQVRCSWDNEETVISAAAVDEILGGAAFELVAQWFGRGNGGGGGGGSDDGMSRGGGNIP